MKKECLFCKAIIEIRESNTDFVCYKCDFCGEYIINPEEEKKVQNYGNIKLSAVLHYRKVLNMPPCIVNQIIEPKADEYVFLPIEYINDMFPINISDRIDMILTNLKMLTEHFGKEISFLLNDIVGKNRALATFFCESSSEEELYYILNTLRKSEMITSTDTFQFGINVFRITLSPKGWDRVIELEKEVKQISKTVFVAMMFDCKTDRAYERIEKSIVDTGYEPIRVDRMEFNSKICDKIIADIRQCKFIICDFTGQRGGVYFEAGFAMGLGKPVIWTCNKNEVENLHFDTNHYNHILWENEDELYDKLCNRIRATII